MSIDRIKMAIDGALMDKSFDVSNIFDEPANARSYKCSVAWCDRKAYAVGYCNAHYMRHRSGRDMDAPLVHRKRDKSCSECGATTGGKGGWGLCSRHYKKKRREIIKDACIEALGGECSFCRRAFHRNVYDFHHVGEKDSSISALIECASSEEIAKELSKCVLLCANCHRLEHVKDE